MSRSLHQGSKLGLAIVGCGDIAGYTALFARLNPAIRLVACCDRDPERAAGFARRYGIRDRYASYETLLAQARPDAVYLAVPHYLHGEMLAAAIAAGVPSLVEKPLAAGPAEGRDVVALAEARGVKVGVNYQYRYDTGCYALARCVQQGELGEVRYVRCNLAWHRDQRYFVRAPWHGIMAAAGGGTLITQGSHLLDVALWALGRPPIAATGYTARRKFRNVEVEDVALGIVETEGGAAIEISSSMAAAKDEPLRIEVYGSRGTAIYSNRPWPRVLYRGVRVRNERPPTAGLHALQRSLEGFRAWVAGEGDFLIPAREALPVLAAVDAVYRSATSGRREMVAEIYSEPTSVAF